MRCIFAWTHAYIQTDGRVTPCCAPVEFGHLINGAVTTAFSSVEANALRRNMAADNDDSLPDACRTCTLLMRVRDDNTFDTYFPSDASQSFTIGDGPVSANHRSLRRAFTEGSELPADARPLDIMVQFGELCNLRCIMCPQDHTSREKLSPANIAHIKDCIPSLFRLRFTGGEPTVFDECWDMTAYFQKHAPPGASLSFLTNLRLVTPKRVDQYFGRIENLGLGINIDAATEETYRKIRVGGNWDALIRNIDYLCEYRDKHNKNWHLNLTVTAMKSNIDEISAVIQMASERKMGFGCGPVTGDAYPLKNTRAFFDENIFRYAHIGYTHELIEEKLELAVQATADLPSLYRESAISNLRGLIEFSEQTQRVDIPAEAISPLRKLDDELLAAHLQAYVNGNGARPNAKGELPPPKTNQASLIRRIAWETKRLTKRMLKRDVP